MVLWMWRWLAVATSTTDVSAWTMVVPAKVLPIKSNSNPFCIITERKRNPLGMM